MRNFRLFGNFLAWDEHLVSFVCKGLKLIVHGMPLSQYLLFSLMIHKCLLEEPLCACLTVAILHDCIYLWHGVKNTICRHILSYTVKVKALSISIPKNDISNSRWHCQIAFYTLCKLLCLFSPPVKY